MAKKSGLGRGLDILFLDNAVADRTNTVEFVKISQIDPKSNQPRKHFDNDALAQLADSISTHGVLQPIILRLRESGRYEIVAGERRWRASKLAGLSEIPAVIVDHDELKTAQIAIVENIQRENLNPLEEAMAYRSLAEDHGMTQEEIATQVGKSRSAIANFVRLLDLPEEILPLVAEGKLSAGHARALLSLKNPENAVILAQKIVDLGLSVRDVENEVKKLNKPAKEEEESPETFGEKDYVADLERRLMRSLGRKAKIKHKGTQKSITLYYEDNMDLEVLLAQLCGADFNEEV